MSIYSQVLPYDEHALTPTPWMPYVELYPLIVIIPAYGETDLNQVYRSLEDCDYNERLSVIILINESVSDTDHLKAINERAYQGISSIVQRAVHIDLYVFHIKDIIDKKAGVGLARRLAMDQAVLMAQSDQTPIINLDADCIVNDSYLSAINTFFKNHTNVELANIHFEHPLEDDRIVQYELHLRYYIEMQRYIKLPYAYHTVGSSFAVRSKAYRSVGRMNLRKAGEDFYFIHKFTKKGTIDQCTKAVVYPSARESDRVPFGTGRAMLEMSEDHTYQTYSIQSLLDLRLLINSVESLYQDGFRPDDIGDTSQSFIDFFRSIKIGESVEKIRANTSTYDKFYKAFFQWFDAFKLMKYLHYMRDHQYPNKPVSMEALQLLITLGQTEESHSRDPKALLLIYRRLQFRG